MRIDNSLLRYEELFKTAAGQGGTAAADGGRAGSVQDFRKILDGKLKEGGITFSRHAEQRLIQREITLSPGDMEKLGSAVRRAGEKGVHNTLVLMDKTAFIVNVPSSTVITALSEKDLREQVFTQIDGAVIA
jgi:flagellar operon protein